MIETIVKDRMKIAGLTQATLAEKSGCSPNQMSIFLNGNGFLSKPCLEKCLSILGIGLDNYSKRFQLAQKAADILQKKGIPIKGVVMLSKKELAGLTGLPEILCFFNVSETELDKILESGIVEVECTYPYFKATVLHLMQIGDSPSPKKVEKSFLTIASFAPLAALPFLGLTGIIGGIAAGALLGNKVSNQILSNAFAPLTIFAKQLFKISKK